MEVEAYGGQDDGASHARFGRTSRNAVMFGPPGRAYVYLVYGMYTCLNVVTGPDGTASAVLIRAVEPIEGAAAMRADRVDWAERRPSASAGTLARIHRLPASGLATGPGLVTIAFRIDRKESGLDLSDEQSSLRLETAAPGELVQDVIATARVGIGYAPEPWRTQPWRLVDAGSPSVTLRPMTTTAVGETPAGPDGRQSGR